MNYIDRDGRISGYINDSKSVGGFGHSAMFVETYDEDGNSTGFTIYEVGTIDKVDDKLLAIGVNQNNNRKEIYLEDTIILSHDSLDGKMGFVAGSILSGSLSGSGASSAVGIGTAGSIMGSIIVESIETSSGVFSRHYDSYDEMKTALENHRYDNVVVFETNQSQDALIMQTAEETGVNFGKYNLFSNNCTQHASNALSAGGVNTTNWLIPNNARNYIVNHNPEATLEDWSKKND